ncbi:fructose-bisphosphate aldolase [Paraburkholderia flagellata]|uniref:fructose-bisphosphate aldolase n=1 Tax=Paraburkholderia flagellata TaxID=2883241 RepID=UPI001F38BCB5|nr:fructose-bisphosphate aldolase [Paraburkholderia flagellata]
MKARSTPWIGAALALVVVLGAPGAWAATPAAGNADVTTATAGVLPPAEHEGDIAFLSGGIGSDQSAAFKSAMHQYPLSLEFARQSAGGNEYLANVPVKIADMHGTPLLSTRTRGPFMLVSIPAGRYVITASYGGNTERRTVDIGKTTGAHETFIWPM